MTRLPIPFRFTPRRQAQRGERGAMVLLMAFGIMLGVIMLGLIVMTGFLMNSDQIMRAYADSWAAGRGLQMLTSPQQNWEQELGGVGELATRAGVTNNLNTPTNGGIYIDYPNASRYKTNLDAYAPAYYMHTVTAGWGQALTSLASALITPVAPTLKAVSAVRVNQVNLANFTIYRQRVMLMLDFSTTMRLRYIGANGAQGETAKEALQKVADTLIKQTTNMYDLGVMGFSDGLADTSNDVADPLGYKTNEDDTDHRAQIAKRVGDWFTRGDGTDIEGALKKAGASLDAAEDKTFWFQKPMVILVTDGEPNVSSSMPPGKAKDLTEAHTAAASDAENQMQGMWDKNNGTYPDRTDSLVFQIQREQNAGLGDSDTSFLKRMAGFNGQNDETYFHADGGDPANITAWLQIIPKYPYCVMTPLTDSTLLGNKPGLLPNASYDTIRAYVTDDVGSHKETVIPADNMFFDDHYNEFAAWSQRKENGATYTTSTDGAQNVASNWLGNPNVLGLYFNTQDQWLVASPMLCAALASTKNLQALKASPANAIRIRLRWGYPSVANPNALDR